MPARPGREQTSHHNGAASSESDIEFISAKNATAAVEEFVGEKVEWTEGSDSGLERFRKRKKNKSGKRPKKRARNGKDKRDPDDPDSEDLEMADMPDYIKERRRTFDANRVTLKDAGLMLPPDFSDLQFSDDERPGKLTERPVFDKKSGVKPCRPHEDILLQESAGVIPGSIAQYLRDYQITGTRFLHRLFVYQRGGILGDDMGLGKTVQVAAFLAAAYGKTGDERDAKRMRKLRRAVDGDERWYPRTLIVCPGSLIANWKNELNRWGFWVVDTYHSTGKDDVLKSATAGRLEIMITTYATYKNHHGAINSVAWDAVVADECHQMKDRASETLKAMDMVNALCRIGLTGTAIQNKYEELWTLLNWTNPGKVGPVSEWSSTISKPLKVGQSHDATMGQLKVARATARKLVDNLLPQFFLRRMKSLIAHQLPRKADRVIFCPLTDDQKQAYDNFLNSKDVQILRTISEKCPCGSGGRRGWCCYDRLSDGRKWLNIVFPSMITLQKLSNHMALLVPSNTDTTDKRESQLRNLKACLPEDWKTLYQQRDHIVNLANPEYCGKWKILRKLLKFWHEAGDKVLVFSHSVRLLRMLQCLFNNTSYNVSYLDGQMKYEDRQTVVDDFNSDPKQFVFLISTKAGGVGLNITSANKVVIVDPHWNPSYDLQAQDRAYRIGQTRDVDVFRLVSVGTIEEIVYARQIYKQQQANIGYTASTERRYFKGVQEDQDRKGEIFGLDNLFSFHGDSPILKDIMNKTNVAEAKAGVSLVNVDMDKVEADDVVIKREGTPGDEEDGGVAQLAAIVAAENQEDAVQKARRAERSKMDAVQAILTSAGVEYTHENSEVIGSSKVEERLSRRAELAALDDDDDDDQDDDGSPAAAEGQFGAGADKGKGKRDSALFADMDAYDSGEETARVSRFRYRWNPPGDVMRRQFCEMARGFEFGGAVEFALVVEGWSAEERRGCLERFYRGREGLLGMGGSGGGEVKGGVGVKVEVKEEVKREVGVKMEHGVKTEPGVKMETPKQEDRKVKLEDIEVKREKGDKKSLIFLSDDEDDEL